ncbi:glycosyltransferase family 4 protein [Dehalococcoidia bacterium]|nr:glycosyltransferase family 4 protein [Dehalococcoidia bacterium]
MKILFVCEYYPPHIGGVEIVFNQLAQGLAKQGHDCHVVTCKVPGTSEYEEVEGVKIHRVKVPKKGDRYWFTFLAIPRVFTLATGADLIHTTTFNGTFPAWVVAKLLRKTAVITVHEVWGPLWGNLMRMSWFSAQLHRFLERAIISLPFDKHISVSEHTRDRLRSTGINDQKSAVIYNGIDHELFHPLKADGEMMRKKLGLDGEFVYMYYGRPGVSKGLEYLISAIPLISERIPNSRLLLILAKEPNDRYEHIRRMISDFNIEDKVALLHPVPRGQLPHYIAACDCVVVPSLSEGFGFAAAEACAMQKPVVASKVASLPEVVSGRHVWVEPGKPEAIATGLAKVYKGETENTQKKEFSWRKCIQGYLEVYDEVMSNREKSKQARLKWEELQGVR